MVVSNFVSEVFGLSKQGHFVSCFRQFLNGLMYVKQELLQFILLYRKSFGFSPFCFFSLILFGNQRILLSDQFCLLLKLGNLNLVLKMVD